MAARARAYNNLYAAIWQQFRKKERMNMEEKQTADIAVRSVPQQDVDDLIFTGETGYISDR